MKKSLTALAALATVATAAQAQSSVTLYGIFDPTLISIKTKNASSITALSHGGAASSRWGFRGEEDLGGGLKAFFNLEGQFEADTGESDAKGLFHRASFVGIKNSLISGQAGRMNRLDYARLAKYDVFAGNNIGGGVALFALSGAGFQTDVRTNNMLQLDVTPVAGLQISAQHAFGEVAGSASSSTSTTDAAGAALRSNSYAVDYKYQNLEVAGVYVRQNTQAGAKQYDRTDAYARYDFGIAKVVYGHLVHDVAGGFKKTGDYLGVVAPISSNMRVLANVASMKVADGAKAKGYAAGVQYDLSKRTMIYGIVAQVDNNGSTVKVGGSAMGEIPTPGTSADQTGYAVGVRHSF